MTATFSSHLVSTDQEMAPPTTRFSRHSETTKSSCDDSTEWPRSSFSTSEADDPTWFHLAAQRLSLAVVTDALDHPVALLDQSGRLFHRNAALAATLSLDPQAVRIHTALRWLARSVVRTMYSACNTLEEIRLRLPQRLDVVTSAHRYRLQATSVGLPAEHATVMAFVARCSPAALSDVELLARYHLTSRERQVARLLAAGMSDGAVANELGISWHTARRHAERVLQKLGVHARTEVAAMLLGDSRGNAATPLRQVHRELKPGCGEIAETRLHVEGIRAQIKEILEPKD